MITLSKILDSVPVDEKDILKRGDPIKVTSEIFQRKLVINNFTMIKKLYTMEKVIDD